MCTRQKHKQKIDIGPNRCILYLMKAVIQRVKTARVLVDNKEISSISTGLLTLLGIEKNDSESNLNKLIDKIVNLRVFEDENGKMNSSLKDTNGAHLIVSQFTLLADCSKGNRPSFTNAEAPEAAKALYLRAIEVSKEKGIPTWGGQFQSHMQLEIINDGPVTLTLEVKNA